MAENDVIFVPPTQGLDEDLASIRGFVDQLDAKSDNIQAKLDLMHAELTARLDEICHRLSLTSTVSANPNDHIGDIKG